MPSPRPPRRRRLAHAAAGLLGAAAVAAWLHGRAADRAPAVRASLALADALGDPGAPGWLRADAPRDFSFPADHGPHAGFRHEWWYWTGNLETDAGRRFGYQLTFFRAQLRPDPLPRASAWGAAALWMAHLAVTDVAAGAFVADERFAREALGLAGAGGAPWRVWLEDWAAAGGDSSGWPLRLAAGAGAVALDLTLAAAGPPVLQGEAGLSRKGSAPGNATYYYSHPRLPTRGRLRVAGREHAVRGSSWFDREWGTSALDSGQVGWDWFALQLDDGRDLMLYRLRRRDGAPDPFSAGSLTVPGRPALPLRAGDFSLDVRDRWLSPATGVEYPARWRVRVPGAGLDLEVRPLVAAQEHTRTFAYWEGCVEAAGTAAGAPVRGRGYVELTGYAPAARAAGDARLSFPAPTR